MKFEHGDIKSQNQPALTKQETMFVRKEKQKTPKWYSNERAEDELHRVMTTNMSRKHSKKTTHLVTRISQTTGEI